MTTQEIIKTIRKEFNLTQAQLAEKFGTTQNRISRMENGKCSLSIDKLGEYLINAGYSVTFIVNDYA